MPAPRFVQRLSALGLEAARALAFLAPSLTRLTLGWAFVLTGRGKLADLETFAGFLASLGVPAASLQAPFVAGLELVGGACLLLGLLTRPMALALAGTMVVALLTSDLQQFWVSWLPTGDVGPMDIAPWTFLLPLLWLVSHGPGPLSLDRLLARWALPRAAGEEPRAA
jgi:putative oxidoreductase